MAKSKQHLKRRIKLRRSPRKRKSEAKTPDLSLVKILNQIPNPPSINYSIYDWRDDDS